MTADRWGQVKQVFGDALEIAPEQRSTFVSAACGCDEALRQEVERLLDEHDRASATFLEPHAPADTADAASLLGTTLHGRYGIERELGRGGSGVVYLARDRQLHSKPVVVKLLHQWAERKPRLQAKFQQEVEALARIQHPGVVAVLDAGESSQGKRFLVMEYVEGVTLRSQLGTPLDLGRLARIIRQAAQALAAAHRQGVYHRDLKPENIMLEGPSGESVRLIDFGIAKVEQSEFAADTKTTVSFAGTFNYAAPEQLMGNAGAASDLYSLAVIAYEMAAGRRPYEPQTPFQLCEMQKAAPQDPREFRPGLPPAAARVIVRALSFRPEDRPATEEEFARSLEEALVQGKGSRSLRWGGVNRWLQRRPRLVPALTAIAFAVIAYAMLRPGHGADTALQNITFTKLTDLPGAELNPALSPDGQWLAYTNAARSGNFDIYMQRVGGREAINLTADSPADEDHPAFSPSGREIAFHQYTVSPGAPGSGGIFVVDVAGGSPGPKRQVSAFGFHPSWSPDGREIVFASRSPDGYGSSSLDSQLWIVEVSTGRVRQITRPEMIPNAMRPSWSPHGRRIAYSAAHDRIWDLSTVAADGSAPVAVISDRHRNLSPVWAPAGDYLYFASDRGGSLNLWRVPIQEESGKALGPPEAITTPSLSSGPLSISQDGRKIVYAQTTILRDLQKVSFDPIKAAPMGTPKVLTRDRQIVGCDVSPDGKWLTFYEQDNKKIFVIKTDGTELRQLTSGEATDRYPRWSPDGNRIAFFSNRTGRYDVWTIGPDGSGLEQVTHTAAGATQALWSPDGKQLAYRYSDGTAFHSFEAAGMENPPSLPLFADGMNRFEAWSWSPDGRKLGGWLVRPGSRGEAGITVYSFASRQFTRLTDFGSQPAWMHDSRRLMFGDRSKFYVVDAESKELRELFSVWPHDINGFALSHDNRTLYYVLGNTEGDIWMARLP